MSTNANIRLAVSAESLAQKLGGKKSGKGWMAHCPAHDDHDPSLSINEEDDKVLVYCHAGCSQNEILDALRPLGLWSSPNGFDSANTNPHTTATVAHLLETKKRKDEEERIARQSEAADRAAKLWDAYKPAPEDHPYLQKKKIGVHGARIDDIGNLVIPLLDTEGKIHGLQYIFPDEKKWFLEGSSTTGHFYLLGEDDPSKPLNIAEGFATGASINEATGEPVAVAFNVGNLRPVSAEFYNKNPKRKYVFASDDDVKTTSNPGLTKANEAARAIGAKVAVPDFGAERPEGVTDFNDLVKLRGPEAVRKSIHAANEPGWPNPQPLTSKTDHEPYPLDALPDILRAAVEEVQVFTKAPIPLVASSGLGALSLACQALIDVKRAEKLQGPSGLFLLTIADSGERKSTCDSYFMKAIQDYEFEQATAAESPTKDYNAAKAAWEEENKAILENIRKYAKDGRSTDTEKNRLRKLEDEKPEPPRVPLLIHMDVTPEALKWILAKKWPSGGVVSSEAGLVLGAHGMGKDSIMRNLATLNQLWDGGSITTERRTSEDFTVRGARLTVALQIQEATLHSFLDNSHGLPRGTGFLARFLIAWPESTQGYRLFSDPPEKWPALERFNQRITEILNRKVEIEADGSLAPRLLSLTEDAKAVWVSAHDTIENKLRSGGELYDVRDVASKIADNVARIAALFHMLEYDVEDSIEHKTVESAFRIAVWHLNEAKRFYGAIVLPEEQINAARMDVWLLNYCRREKTNIILSRDLQRNVTPVKLRQKPAFDTALAELVALDRV